MKRGKNMKRLGLYFFRPLYFLCKSTEFNDMQNMCKIIQRSCLIHVVLGKVSTDYFSQLMDITG